MFARPKVVSVSIVAVLAVFVLLARAQNKSAAPPAEKKAAAGAKAGKSKKAPGGDPKTDSKPPESPTEGEIRASAAAFTKLYNAHDAKGLAQLFAIKAEITDEGGKLVKGREAIEAEFAQQFQDEPECRIEVDIDSIRILTPNIAIEEGVVRSSTGPDQPEEVSNYACVHVRVDGKWLLASVSDFPAEAEDLTPHEHLRELSWMLGEWIDESPDSNVHSLCQWDESGNFLLYDFEVQFAGSISMNGTTRIGWDAVRKQFRSWVFDSEGGFTEGIWIRIGEEWVVKVTGGTPAGETCSSTNVYRQIDDDTFTFRSYDRIVDGELTDDIDETIIKRHAPAPAD